MPETLALIPARGGSQSIPRKNIALLAGKPLIAWTIEAAQRSCGLGRIVVTTDDAEIADVARTWGAEVPFLRPAELARNDTPGIAPLLHAVRWLAEHEQYRPNQILLLQPTSPLRCPEDIEASLTIMAEKEADSVVSLAPVSPPPCWMKCVDEEGRVRSFLPTEKPITRRQDMVPVYGINGAIYLIRRDILCTQETLYTERTFAYLMPQERSLDIDSLWDFHLAELILSARPPATSEDSRQKAAGAGLPAECPGLSRVLMP
jgi:N-acylneuraminate cytidylyltransferase/CMP-N,N'-diacetyllegionaminic acid synthase